MRGGLVVFDGFCAYIIVIYDYAYMKQFLHIYVNGLRQYDCRICRGGGALIPSLNSLLKFAAVKFLPELTIMFISKPTVSPYASVGLDHNEIKQVAKD